MVSKTKNEYSLNLSLSYAAQWGLERAVREIGTNAIDANPDDYEVYIEDDTLVVRNGAAYDENGKPIVLDRKHWIMGESEGGTNENRVGHFGEGLKVGVVVLLRLGYTDISIRSGWYSFKPEIRKFSNGSKNSRGDSVRHVVWVEETEESSFYKGTLVRVDNFSRSLDLRDIFLFPDDLRVIYENVRGRLLREDIPNLYTSSTRVCEMQSIFDKEWHFGYAFHPDAITLERDRTLPQSYEVRQAVTRFWEDVDEPDLWLELWSAIKSDKAESKIEWENFRPYSNLVIDAAKAAFHRQYGEKVVISTDHSYHALLERNTEYVPVQFKEHLAKFLIKNFGLRTDVEIAFDTPGDSLDFDLLGEFDASLNVEQSLNLRMLQRRTNKLAEYLKVESFQWEVKPKSSTDTEGELILDQVVSRRVSLIAKSVLSDRNAAFETWYKHVIHQFYGIDSRYHWNYNKVLLELSVLAIQGKI